MKALLLASFLALVFAAGAAAQPSEFEGHRKLAIAGLDGGTLRSAGRKLVLDRYSITPGITVSGTLRASDSHGRLAFTGPVTVVLWAQTRRTADLVTVKAVIGADAQLVVGGPGWTSARLPKKVVRVDSLRAALRYLSES